MLKNTILTFLLFYPIVFFGQFGEQQIISTEANLPRAVYAADLDGDGDMDILSASEADDKVAWYENTDGLGTFGSQQIITENLHAAVDVYSIDIDGDEDMDLLVASKGYSPDDSKVVWYENLDGLGNYGALQIISTSTSGAVSVFATDLDNDGDIDVLSASFTDNKIAWYENTDGLGDFGPQQIITNQALSTRDVYAADLDGDEDMDVLVASTASDEVLWFENLDGLGDFGTARVITAIADGVLSVYAADIDGDGDLDVLSAEFGDDTIAWFENVDGLGNFGSEQIISSNAFFAKTVYATDLDNDGDLDVLSAASDNSYISWYENTNGLGVFGSPQIITNNVDGARDAYAEDLDNDGDMDVLSASSTDDKIAWYENFTILGVEDTFPLNIKIFPNPANTLLYFSNNSDYAINAIQIKDIQGKLIIQVDEYRNQLDISILQAGIYLVRITTDKGELMKKIIKE